MVGISGIDIINLHRYQLHSAACEWFPFHQPLLMMAYDRWLEVACIQSQVQRPFLLSNRVFDISMIGILRLSIFIFILLEISFEYLPRVVKLRLYQNTAVILKSKN